MLFIIGVSVVNNGKSTEMLIYKIDAKVTYSKSVSEPMMNECNITRCRSNYLLVPWKINYQKVEYQIMLPFSYIRP